MKLILKLVILSFALFSLILLYLEVNPVLLWLHGVAGMTGNYTKKEISSR